MLIVYFRNLKGKFSSIAFHFTYCHYAVSDMIFSHFKHLPYLQARNSPPFAHLLYYSVGEFRLYLKMKGLVRIFIKTLMLPSVTIKVLLRIDLSLFLINRIPEAESEIS